MAYYRARIDFRRTIAFCAGLGQGRGWKNRRAMASG